MMDPILGAWREWLVNNVTFTCGTIPFYSNLNGEACDRTDADYWTRQIRQPVSFLQGVQNVLAQGEFTFIDLSADGSLGKFVIATDRRHRVLAAGDRRHEYKSLLTLLGTLTMSCSWRVALIVTCCRFSTLLVLCFCRTMLVLPSLR